MGFIQDTISGVQFKSEEWMLLIPALFLSFALTFVVMPYLISFLKKRKIVGIDVNKSNKPEIPEMGGLGVLIGLTAAIIILLLSKNYFNADFEDISLIGILGVFVTASIIGIIDDIWGISRLQKIILLLLPSIPLLISKSGNPIISTPFFNIDFGTFPWLYWYILVPIGITGAANAINMSAGYNGLESGEVAVISFFLSIISFIKNPEGVGFIIFAALFGASLALYLFNRYPAKVFVGDVGTLGMGALIGGGVITGNIEFYGIICILPVFYQLFPIIYYDFIKGIGITKRRYVLMHPEMLEGGRLKPSSGAGWYTLPFLILNLRPMTENQLVNSNLMIFILFGLFALGLALI